MNELNSFQGAGLGTRTTALLGAFALVGAGCAAAARAAVVDEVVTYEVSLPAPQTQRVEIVMTIPCAGEREVEVLLPTWRPGKYSILNPVSTLRELQAAGAGGAALAVEQTSKSSWRVETGGGERVEVRYSIFANSIGDRTRHVDDSHAFLSGSSVFLYTPGLREAPVRVELDLPDGWGVACGLEAAPGEEAVLVAPNYDVLVDSPLELGAHDRHTFEAQGAAHELIVWPRGVDYDVERVLADFAKIVDAQAAMFGGVPYERYVFLLHVGAGGGGTEHLNSTIMQTSRAALEGSYENDSAYKRLLSLTSHELFHTWNVKQLRPAGMHPYDYQGENYTDLLWLVEGGTSYFGGLTLARGGLTKPDKYLSNLSGSIDSLRKRPGARVQSVAASSFDSWTKATLSSVDDVNTEVSIYSKGLVVSLLLDMEVRTRSGGAASLDAVMNDLFERFPLDGPGYTSADLLESVERYTGSDFDGFFARYVNGTEPLPLEAPLLAVGVELFFEPAKRDDDEEDEDESGGASGVKDDADAEPPVRPYLGLRLRSGGSGCTVSAVLADGPAYDAGVLAGDEILTLNGRRLRSGELDKRIKRLEPGTTVTLHLLRRDELQVVEVELAGVPDGKWKLRRVKEPTDAQKAGYASWIGHDWPEKNKDDEPEKPEPEAGG
ncbi:MAG: PDZ domain-containing protein [Planctomycetota bacterium]